MLYSCTAVNCSLFYLKTVLIAKKIPVGIDIYGWGFAYAGVYYDEVDGKPQECAAAFCKFFDEHPLVDMTATNGVSGSSVKALNALGMENYVYSGDRTSAVHNQANEVYFGPEVYEEIIRDADTFLNVTYPRFKLENLLKKPFDEAVKDFRTACIAAKADFDTNAIISEHLTNDLQIYGLYDESEIMYSFLQSPPRYATGRA